MSQTPKLGSGAVPGIPVTGSMVGVTPTSPLTGTTVQEIIDELATLIGSSMWFNVTDAAYGAVGDGTTDDTTAINLAIAALNTATRGVLYFPAGSYKTTAALTAITAACIVRGDGSASFDYAEFGTSIFTTSGTAVMFTMSGKISRFENLALLSNSGGTPSAGAAILVDSAYLEQRCDFSNIHVRGFYDGIDSKVNSQWSMTDSIITAPVRYGLRIRNTVNADAGDGAIVNSWFYADAYNATSAIRVESSGGLKIDNCKINMALSGNKFATGLDIAVAGSVATGDLLVANTSIENVTGHGISFTTSGGTSTWRYVLFTGVQIALGANTAGNAINVNCTTLGDVHHLEIDNCSLGTDGASSQFAISLTKVNVAKIDAQSDGFGGGFLTTSGCTTIMDASGGVGNNVAISGVPSAGDVPTATGATTATWQPASSVSFATPAIVLGTAAAAGAASTVIRSDSTIVAFDATVPVTQAFGDTADAGNVAVAARRNHRHGMPAAPASSAHYLVIASSHSTPLVFDDIVQNSAGDDFTYTS